jgi:ABC-type branched-subunit amino acid transport system ATPase component
MSTLLAVEEIGVAFGGNRALDDVSFAVESGTAFGLIGPNGAGKSTMIDAISGYLPQATGTVRFGDRTIGRLKPHRRAALGLARTFQTLELFEDLTVRENLLVSAEHTGWGGAFLDLVRPGRVVRVDAVERALELLELTDVAEALPGELSHGHRNLVSVARALSAQPKLLLLDEPAAGLDSEESTALGRRLRRLVGDGITVLLVDHDMGLVMGICDHVHVLDFGRTIASGTPTEIRDNPAVVAAYLGGADELDEMEATR